MGALDLPHDIALKRHRLAVEAYMPMREAGIIAPDARTELIEGEVLDMAPIGTRHASTVKRLAKALGAAGDHAIVAVQDPVHLGRRSMPQVCRGPKADGQWAETSESARPGLVGVGLLPGLAVDFEPIFGAA
jgi:hypothetical protein